MDLGNHVTERTTEGLHPKAIGLDVRPLPEVALVLAEAQAEAAAMAQFASPLIANAAVSMAATIRTGGVLHYAAAGSSGLMAAADAQELGGTYSTPPEQLRIHMAGGLPRGAEMPGDTEDQTEELTGALGGMGSDDTLIVVSASGETPYAVAAADIARKAGACVIGIANNAGSSLLKRADHPILLATPPEVIAGSTRMGAGTAQKIALNMLSTCMAVELGHVHDGMMVNLRADNAKLRGRARGMVARIAGVSGAQAQDALERAEGDVKTGILLAAGVATPQEAQETLLQAGGHLRTALKNQT